MASSEIDFVEERLRVLDSWLADQPDNDKLLEKKDEYLGLLEELRILTKKFKKVSKLLVEGGGDQTTPPIKLAKKQEQYSEEIEQILEYVDQDPLFEEAEMDPSDLLGVPLETLVEQPGMEGSSATLNFSVSDLPYMPPRSSKSIGSGNSSSSAALDFSTNEEYEELRPISEEQSLHFNSMASLPSASAHSNSSMGSFPMSTHSTASIHDAATLRKKLKKVETLLSQNQQDMDRKELKKLMKKRNEYTKALQEQGAAEEQDDTDDHSLDGNTMHSFAESSIATMDVSTSSLFRLSQSGGITTSNPKKYDKRTLQKKLRKVRQLLQSTTNEKELESYHLKEQEYEQALDDMAAAENGSSSISSFGDSYASVPTSMDDLLVEMDKEERKQFKTLQKKLAKVDALIEEAEETGSESQAKKLRRKKDEYTAAMDALINR